MAIVTSRTNENARVEIDYNICTDCFLCEHVCPGKPLFVENGRVHVDQSRIFGCIGCGLCVAVCPEDCITVEGREMRINDFFILPNPEEAASYESFVNLMQARRSIRHFKKQEVPQDIVDKILNAASFAPMGLPPSDVDVIVLNGFDKVKEFSDDFVNYVSSIRYMFTSPALMLMRPFISKEDAQTLKSFVQPMLKYFVEKKKEGEDWLLYGAPLAFCFQTGPYADPADSHIAATYAMIAAESLGLGTCMIGSVVPFIKKGAKGLKSKWDINPKIRDGLFLIVGYPKYKFRKGIKRTFAKVHYA
jgi:nitroreductase/Pyruvate/2-oxoacid:ferredoxin oxidoreductase delta subunit